MSTEHPVPHFLKPLLETPFHARARALSQHDSYVPWAGYTTVDVFTSAEQEYFAIRNASTLYDITPMVKYRVAGPDAERYLNHLVTRDVRKLRVGRVSYVVWCNDDGHIIDDGTLFRLGPNDFRLCTAERQLDWLLDSAIGFDVAVDEVTEDIAALSMQGPTSCYILKRFGLEGIDTLKPFELRNFTARGQSASATSCTFTALSLTMAWSCNRFMHSLASSLLRRMNWVSGFMAKFLQKFRADRR